jgi:hypothetical protein
MPTFVAGSFAVAGLIAAAAPLVIHLLNRRRYRVVDWAAMDLLREALARNRRILHLRDLLLLILRTACVLLFALALAQPHMQTTSAASDPNQPVHAVIVVDNSLSMGYQRLDGTLLEEAKTRINEFLDRLPPGSRISMIPACGSSQAWSNDVYRTTADAREALARIEVADRPAVFSASVDLAAQACTLAPEVPTKRVVFVGDQQRLNWPVGGADTAVKSLPDVQIVQIASDEPRTNAWVADFRLQDDIADVEAPAVFTGVVRYEGAVPRNNVEAVLTVDGARVAAQTIDLEPGQSRQVRFAHQIDAPVESGEFAFIAASLSLSPDQLPGDDVKYLMVPVVAALPVLFIDNLGAVAEDPRHNRYGETFHLRRLLSPVRSRDEAVRQLVHVRHLAAHQVERQHLEDCRLVVMAGVESPQSLTTLLREYVEQGGQLLIAAGGDFDPAAWSSRAWLDGAGVLPLPLESEAIGRVPDDTSTELQPFFLSPDTMTDERFAVADASREDLDDLYRTPLFFKAVAVDAGQRVLDDLLQADAERETAARRNDAGLAPKPKGGADLNGPLPTDLRPHWLLWGRDRLGLDPEESVDTAARRQQPQILAKYSNGLPFLVERHIGRGDVLFVSTGVLSGWNNLTRTNAVVLLDRLLRRMLVSTLPRRNYGTNERAVFAIAPADRRADFSLARPGGTSEPLFVDAIGPERFAVTLRNLTQRGDYRLSAEKLIESARPTAADAGSRTSVARAVHADRLWQVDLAVNGPADESDLQTIGEVELQKRLGDAGVRWVAQGEPICLEGAAVRGQEFWKWLMAAALAGLILELAILSRSQAATSQKVALSPDVIV